MAERKIPLKRGSLLETIKTTARIARKNGGLHSIPTQSFRAPDMGIEFIVRKVESLADKDREAKLALDISQGTRKHTKNPFLPYDEAMYVGHVTPTHVCLLNKYNVVDDHILLVTTEFEHQDCVLTPGDFEALALCLYEFESLAFYNGGKISGASQPHKHLQVVPLPLTQDGPPLPMEPAILSATWKGDVGKSREIPFSHFLARPPRATSWRDPPSMAKTLHSLYRALLSEASIRISLSSEWEKAAPYNLLVTRNWMMLVPRTREFFGTISLNALAFAGTLLVRTKSQHDELESRGCASALKFATE